MVGDEAPWDDGPRDRRDGSCSAIVLADDPVPFLSISGHCDSTTNNDTNGRFLAASQPVTHNRVLIR